MKQDDNLIMPEPWGELIPYFREFKKHQLDKIKRISKVYTCKGGDLVYLQGEFSLNWVVINNGNFLVRTRDEENFVKEQIIHEGESYDLQSIITDSVTSCSLEAIGNSSILVIDIPGLKKIAQKSPEIISLIKDKLPKPEAESWNRFFFENEIKSRGKYMKIRESLLSIFTKVFPIAVISLAAFFILTKFLDLSRQITGIVIFVLFAGYFLVTVILKRMEFIEVNRDSITKRKLAINSMSAVNISVPINKVTGSKIVYEGRFWRIFKLGSICFESAAQNLEIKGIFKPESTLNLIEKYRKSTVNINKAIEVSSFKSTYCEKNNLFSIESQLQNYKTENFVFRKSILSFIIVGVPPFAFFALATTGLFFIFKSYSIFLFNIISFGYLLWHLWDWINDKYAFEGSKVVDIEKKPLWGRESRVEADISSVQSIKKEQKNIIELLFNYGTIEIETLGETIVYPFISNPDGVIENLYLVKQFYYSKQESENRIQRQEEFLNYTKYYQELSGK